jgi:hypothetical protein
MPTTDIDPQTSISLEKPIKWIPRQKERVEVLKWVAQMRDTLGPNSSRHTPAETILENVFDVLTKDVHSMTSEDSWIPALLEEDIKTRIRAKQKDGSGEPPVITS